MFSKSRLITVGLTIAVLAIAMRVEPVKEAITGESKFLGLF